MRLSALVVIFPLAALATAGTAQAQGRGGGAWTTAGGDAQRSGSLRTDPRISKESAQTPAFQLLWKRQLDQKAQGALTPPVLLPNIISYKGFKALAYLAGADTIYSIDYDLNKMFWDRKLAPAASNAGGAACQPAMSAITRPTPLGQAAFGAGRGGGRGAAGAAAPPAAPPPAGAPGAPPAGGGAPAGIPPGAGAGAAPGTPPAPAPGAQTPPAAGRGRAGGPGGGGGGGGRGGNNNVYAVSSGGMVHALNPQTGEDVNPPAKFLGPNAKVTGAVFIDNVLYAAATGNCGGVANGVYAIDLNENANTVTSWSSNGAAIAGSLGPAFGSDGTIYVATGAASGDASFANAVVALDGLTLKPANWFSASTPFTSSPVVFVHKGKTFVAAGNSDGSLYVVDGAATGGSDHRTAVARSPQYSASKDFSAGSLSTWEDADGTRWIALASGGALSPATKFASSNGSVTSGAVVAFRLEGEGDTMSLQPAWSSRDIPSPGAPLVLNGVAFVVSNGEYRAPGARAPRGQRSVLYALDATTGKELWNSGNAIASFVHGAPLSGGDGQVYVVTNDGTLYAFGIPLEH
jgi:hypothetical protein